MTDATRLLRPGDCAPDITLPSAISEDTISLAEHRKQRPVLLVLLRGLY